MPTLPAHRIKRENDSCAIIAFVDKRGKSSHSNIAKTIEALKKMAHRSGDIQGEGDGCGVLTDIPRDIWAGRLEKQGLSPHLAESRGFFITHLLIPSPHRSESGKILPRVQQIFDQAQADRLIELQGRTRDHALGPRSRAEAPLFVQIAALLSPEEHDRADQAFFRLHLELEKQIAGLHVASLSRDSVVYKLRGIPEMLPRVYPELLDENARSAMSLGHGRYSTNTLPTVERAQPFTVLGHNGEINTIERLRSAGRVLGIQPVPGGSDSQDLNRVIEGLINRFDLTLMEAMEMLFPAIHSETMDYSPELRELYGFYRWFFPASAQGPAAIIARHKDLCMGSVDALGLRPLWFGESNYDFFLSSEKGVVDLENTVGDPRPLAPGEKIAISGGKGRQAEVLDYPLIQQRLLSLLKHRRRSKGCSSSLYTKIPTPGAGTTERTGSGDVIEPHPAKLSQIPSLKLTGDAITGAFGWQASDLSELKKMTASGRAVVGSMGHQAPLACMNLEALPVLADYFKENVAVVTNPAIDREREAAHFATAATLGSRPDIGCQRVPPAVALTIESPLLLSLSDLEDLAGAKTLQKVSRSCGGYLLEEILDFFTSGQRDPARVCRLEATFHPSSGLKSRLEELCSQAVQAVRAGAVIVILDDRQSFAHDRAPIDPGLGLAHLNNCLENTGLRRECSLVVRSAQIRNLHDIMFLLGLGADALNPYLLWRLALAHRTEDLSVANALSNAGNVLRTGIEKVMSTMGIHELCGYGRVFASIGLRREVEEVFQCANFCSSPTLGTGFDTLEELGRRRCRKAASTADHPLAGAPRQNIRVGKILRNAALGKTGHAEMTESLSALETERPLALRHLLETVPAMEKKQLAMSAVDISIGRHDMPLVIAAMSFGSQGENSFRTYAEAGRKANVVCMNGEGGEIPDMLGKYRHNRGQQIASGRFGVTMALLNSADYLEIKIGQGAKPGEGGHLPGNKVSPMVAEARHCKPGVTLISPSNQHDIYSIEDLMQIVTELKTASPAARVSVKIPVTSGVGTIAVGIAKAGADIVNISGFEGGTGAAREHAKKFVGLPVEIGVSEAHRALVESGLRHKVEIWADGGLRSGRDALKMVLLGANRIGLGTAALMALGCISCQRCHLDRCPRGISTQIRTREEAESRGVKGFAPRLVETEAENLARLLRAMGDELRHQLARMGQQSLQALVGRVDLLQQVRMTDTVDSSELLRPPPPPSDTPAPEPRPGSFRRPLNHLTKLVSDLAMERFGLGLDQVEFLDEGVRSTDRAMGTYLAGAMVREYGLGSGHKATIRLTRSVPGNGLCAFNIPGIETLVHGGAQDGAAKGGVGGLLAVLKERNLSGELVDGSVGKSFAYGAIGGTYIVQNRADSRACVRLSGADVVFGARITEPVRDQEGNIASRSHLKGFAFEYMTGGRAVVLCDPGPWICSGMTGGVVYQCLYPEFYFNRKAVLRRVAQGASVRLATLDDRGLADVEQLLSVYIRELKNSYQDVEAAAVQALLDEARQRFVAITPRPLDIAES